MALSRQQSEERKVSFIRLTVLRVAVVAFFLTLADYLGFGGYVAPRYLVGLAMAWLTR